MGFENAELTSIGSIFHTIQLLNMICINMTVNLKSLVVPLGGYCNHCFDTGYKRQTPYKCNNFCHVTNSSMGAICARSEGSVGDWKTFKKWGVWKKWGLPRQTLLIHSICFQWFPSKNPPWTSPTRPQRGQVESFWCAGRGCILWGTAKETVRHLKWTLCPHNKKKPPTYRKRNRK